MDAARRNPVFPHRPNYLLTYTQQDCYMYYLFHIILILHKKKMHTTKKLIILQAEEA